MSIAPGLEISYNTACAECGLVGWEHEPTCSHNEPVLCTRCDAPLTDEARCGNCGWHQ